MVRRDARLCERVAPLRRWATFIVTADRFYLNKRVFSPEGQTVSWPRGAIGGAKFIEYSNQISIRLYGRDPLELSLGYDPATSRHVAHVLDDALNGHFEPVEHTEEGILALSDSQPRL